MILGAAPIEGRLSGVVDIPNSCCDGLHPDRDLRLRRAAAARTGRTRSTRARGCRRRASEAHVAKRKAKVDRLTSPVDRSRAVPIADYGFLSDCEVVRARRARAAPWSGCACRASTRRACSAPILDRDAGRLPARRRWTSTVPAARRYLPGHDDPGDELGHADRLDHRARRAADRARGTTRTTARTPTAARRPTTTPSTSCCAPSAACPARCRSIMDCEPVFDYGRARVRWEYTERRLPPGPWRAPTGVDVELTPDHRPAARASRAAQASARTLLKEGDIRFVALSWGEHRAAARPTTRPTSGWCGPPTTGSTGSPAASSPTTRGAATCSAAR